MLCHTQLHDFNVTVRYRAYDAPQTHSWLGEGRRGILAPWRGGYPSPFLSPSRLGVFWHRGPLIPPKVWQPLTPLYVHWLCRIQNYAFHWYFLVMCIRESRRSSVANLINLIILIHCTDFSFFIDANVVFDAGRSRTGRPTFPMDQ